MSFDGHERRLFHHAAHETIGVSAGLDAYRVNRPADGLAVAGPTERPLSLCLVAAVRAMQSAEPLWCFEGYLRQRYGVRCHRAWYTSRGNSAGMEPAGRCDCMLLVSDRVPAAGAAGWRIRRYAADGGPLVAVRTAGTTIEEPFPPERTVPADDVDAWGKAANLEVRIAEAAEDHPALKGVEPFTARGSLCRDPRVARGATLLLTGTVAGQTEPVAWAHVEQGSRRFFTSLGHPDDFRKPSFARLLANAIFWTTGRSPMSR